ncbi:MAG: stage II sporulation protein M [Candidatus Bathyarchaeota archaeon]|nr:stage II sporulation protein M [Candidatus Bathyarchaeota archaeon]MDW8040250.1 stage II sporulation protein M [Nitrososphaerota archaeon]
MSNFWKGLPTKVKRIIAILMFFLLSIAATVAGVSTPLTREEVSSINEEMKELREYVLKVDIFRGSTLIFGNNFFLCLSFFAPFAGPVFGFYVLYSTGVVIAAQSIDSGINPHWTFLSLFIFPFTWLEFLSYSIAFAESAWLSWRIVKRNWKRELVNACIMVSICAVMLLMAAFIEMAIIKAFT